MRLHLRASLGQPFLEFSDAFIRVARFAEHRKRLIKRLHGGATSFYVSRIRHYGFPVGAGPIPIWRWALGV
jgi:hypothetical protein